MDGKENVIFGQLSKQVSPPSWGTRNFFGGEKKISTLLGRRGLATSLKQMGLSFRKT
jgi:hypothetical protein